MTSSHPDETPLFSKFSFLGVSARSQCYSTSWVMLCAHGVGGTKLELRHDIHAGKRLQNPEKAERRATEMSQGLEKMSCSLEG